MNRRELPLLGGIAAFIRWVEELANLLSGPLLTLGLGIALIDLLTDGSLLAHMPLLLYAWAVSQAVGVDAQLVATWDRARIALREHRYWSLFGLFILGAVLAYVAWVAAQVFALQESEGVTTAQALARLGFDSAIWLIQRTALSVFLVALSGWTRYHPPAANVAEDAQAERERLEAELLLEPLRQQKRAMQLRGARGAIDALRGKDAPVSVETPPAPSETRTGASGTLQEALLPAAQFTPWELVPDEYKAPPSKPPTGPGSPARKRGVRNPRKKSAKVVRLRNGSAEERAAAAWSPGMSIPALEKAAGISRATAQKYSAKFSAAHQSEQAAQ